MAKSKTTDLTAQPMGAKRAVLYCRVSTEEQRVSGHGLDTQLASCRKYAAQNGFEVVGEFQEDFTGTVAIELRPEGKRAVDLLKSDNADVLIVDRLDRLVRPPEDGDEWDIPILVRGLAKLRRDIYTVSHGKIETTFVGLLMAVIEGKGAGDDRRKILKNLTDGKRTKAKSKWVGISVPFGYTKVGKGKDTRLEINHEQAATVKRLFAMYLGLNGEAALGFDSIAQKLNEEGVPHPNRKHGKAKRWHSSTVGKILENRIYIGEAHWGGEVAQLPELAIIDRAIFERAQEQRARNKIECTRNTKHEYLLRNWFFCTCGRRMSCVWVFSNGKCYLYYQCNRKGFDKVDGCGCDGLKVRADVADAIAWAWLADVITNPGRMQRGLEQYARKQREMAEPTRQRLELLPGLIADTEKQATRLAEALQRMLVETEDDDLAVRTIEAQLKQISDAHKRYKKERDMLQAEMKAGDFDAADLQAEVAGMAAEIRQGIADDVVSFATKRRIAERYKVSAAVEYQDGVRGLRLRCVVGNVNTWKPLGVCNHSLSSDLSFQPQVRSIS